MPKSVFIYVFYKSLRSAHSKPVRCILIVERCHCGHVEIKFDNKAKVLLTAVKVIAGINRLSFTSSAINKVSISLYCGI